MTLVGGNGDDTFVAYDPNTVITAGTGVDTVLTWGSGYTLPAGVDNLTLEGSGNAFAAGNSGNNIITGNAGTDTLITGGGNDILIAGTGADTFSADAGHANTHDLDRGASSRPAPPRIRSISAPTASAASAPCRRR